MWIAVLAAAAAGACFAFAGVLQQRVASTRPEGESLSPRLLLDLAKQRLWRAGIALAFLSYALQGLALSYGPLALVQPILVAELIFAVPVSARLHRMRLGWREWTGVLAVGAGLAVAIGLADPRGGEPLAAALPGWLGLLAAATCLTVVALTAGKLLSGAVRASLFALAGATVMGTQSALFAATVARVPEGFGSLFTAWQTYLLVVASIGGLMLIQSAYQAGPLAASMPVIDTVEPVVAITIGLALFHETVAGGLLPRVVAGTAMAVVVAGIVILDSAPVTRQLHRREQRSEERTDPREQIRLTEQ